MAAEIEGARKRAADLVEPLGQPRRRLAEEEVVRVDRASGALAVAAHGGAVEHVDAGRVGHGRRLSHGRRCVDTGRRA